MQIAHVKDSKFRETGWYKIRFHHGFDSYTTNYHCYGQGDKKPKFRKDKNQNVAVWVNVESGNVYTEKPNKGG